MPVPPVQGYSLNSTMIRRVCHFKEQLAPRIACVQEYDFSMVHGQGKLRGNADALLHGPWPQCGRDSHCLTLFPHLHQSPACMGTQVAPDLSNNLDLSCKVVPMTVTAVTLQKNLPTISLEDQLNDDAVGSVIRAFQEGVKQVMETFY